MGVCSQTGQAGGALLSLSDAVSQAARSAGVRPLSPTGLQEELDSQELQEAYSDQVGSRTFRVWIRKGPERATKYT